MKDTKKATTAKNLIKIVKENCTPETLTMIGTELESIRVEFAGNTRAMNKATIEWVMECLFTFEQPFKMIVRNLESKTWCLLETDEEEVDAENSMDFADWTGRV